MSEDLELQLARRTPAYRAGVWAFRAMLLVLVMHFSLIVVYGSVYASVGGIWFLFGYCVPMIVGYVCFSRAGVRILGYSQGIWGRRRMVYRDVLGLRR